MKQFFIDFKNFAMKGNILDMAIGVVMGTAFTAIVNSLVKDVFTPIISALTGVANFENLNFKLGEAIINYGNFLNAIISFIIVAFSIFCMIKVMSRLMKEKQKEETKETPKPSREEELLSEIRDLLKQNKN